MQEEIATFQAGRCQRYNCLYCGRRFRPPLSHQVSHYTIGSLTEGVIVIKSGGGGGKEVIGGFTILSDTLRSVSENTQVT